MASLFRPGSRATTSQRFPSDAPAPRRHYAPARRIWRSLRRHRRLISSLLLCLAAALAAERLTPAPPRTMPVVVAHVDLPLGTVLSTDDLEIVEIPVTASGTAVGTAQRREDVTGSILAVPLRRGQLLSQNLLVGPRLLWGMQPGTAAVPLRLADPGSAGLLNPGQLVDVIVTTESPGRADRTEGRANRNEQLAAAAVPVLWVQRSGSPQSPWSAPDVEGLIVVAAASDQARQLAATRGTVSIVLVSPQNTVNGPPSQTP